MGIVPFKLRVLGDGVSLTHDGPWDPRYIYLDEWLMFMVNVGKYTGPMDPKGYISFIYIQLIHMWGFLRFSYLKMSDELCHVCIKEQGCLYIYGVDIAKYLYL